MIFISFYTLFSYKLQLLIQLISIYVSLVIFVHLVSKYNNVYKYINITMFIYLPT